MRNEILRPAAPGGGARAAGRGARPAAGRTGTSIQLKLELHYTVMKYE